MKIKDEKSIDLIKKHSMMCKLLALKADDTGVDREYLIAFQIMKFPEGIVGARRAVPLKESYLSGNLYKGYLHGGKGPGRCNGQRQKASSGAVGGCLQKSTGGDG
ncbi:MAG: hypothetical protein HQK66_15275 [Desulfamplus sp.]|nr:hypothetical protein [Desulfamplus sp.]